MGARTGSTMVAIGVLAVLLVLLRANLDQVQGAENLSAGGLPSLELRVTAVEKALLAKVIYKLPSTAPQMERLMSK